MPSRLFALIGGLLFAIVHTWAIPVSNDGPPVRVGEFIGPANSPPVLQASLFDPGFSPSADD